MDGKNDDGKNASVEETHEGLIKEITIRNKRIKELEAALEDMLAQFSSRNFHFMSAEEQACKVGGHPVNEHCVWAKDTKRCYCSAKIYGTWSEADIKRIKEFWK
jgi:hypothetical protein